jgi:hypothetical protein
MESDSDKNNVNKIDENIPTSQPSAALALTALLDNTKEELKPIVTPVLQNLPDEIIIGMAVSLLPDVNINISLSNPNEQLDKLNLKIEEKNEKKANEISNNPNLQTLNATNVIGNIAGSTINATSKVGNVIGIKNKLPIIINNFPRLGDKARDGARKVLTSIKNLKNKTLQKLKLKSKKGFINKKIMNEAVIEANSFLADKRLNDTNSISNRMKSLINHKNIKTSLIKESIISNLNKNKTNNIKKIINQIINDRNKIIKLNRYFNASRAADNLKNLFKTKNNSNVDIQINNLTNDDNIKLNIADALTSDNSDILIDIIYSELKKREVFDKMDNQQKIVNELIALIRTGNEQKVSSFIDTIVNFISASEYNNQLNLALSNNDDKSLSNIIYQLLVEKLNDQDNIIKKIGRKLGLNIKDTNIGAVKNSIMLGTAKGQIKNLEKKLLESKEGQLVLNELKKNSINVVNDVKSTLRNLSIIPRGNKKSSISTNSLNDIKDGHLKKLIFDVMALNYTNTIIEKRLIINTANKLGIHLSNDAYTKTILDISTSSPNDVTKSIVDQLSKYKIGKKIIKGIKSKAITLSNRDKANNADTMANNLRLDIEKAKIDAAVSGRSSDVEKIKLLQAKLIELENISKVLKEHADNTQVYDDSRNLINIAAKKSREAKINLDKVRDALNTASSDPIVERTLRQALIVAEDQNKRANITFNAAKNYIQNKWNSASSSSKKIENININNPEIIKTINKSIEIKNKISGVPEVIEAKSAGKSALSNIKHGNVKGLVNDVIRLNKAKAALEKKIIVGTAAKLGVKISDKNYDRLRMAMASTTPMGAAKTLIVVLSKTPAGKKLINNIKQKATNAVKHNKAQDANIHAEFITEEARRLNEEANISNNPNDKIAAKEALKKAEDARNAASILNEHAIAASAVTETKSLIEVARMKLSEAKNNVTKLNEKLNFTKESKERASIENDIKLANLAVDNAEMGLADAQVTVKKFEQESANTGNKVINYLQTRPQIQAEINKLGETKESAKKAVEALKSGDKKEIISSAKDLMQQKTELTKGAYKSAGSAVGLNLSDQDVKEIQKAQKAAKNAAKAGKAAMKMKNLLKGPAAFIIAIVAIILEKTLNLDEDDFAKCKAGDFDLSSIPDWAKKVIDMIPGLGELFDLIGNKLCIKQGCPEHKPENSGGLCYPSCQKSFKSDGAMLCWKQYPDFENNGEGHTITSITQKVTTNTGTIPDRCGPGEDKNGALCYPACRSGFNGVGPVCWERCKDGTVDTGIRCEKSSYGRGAGRVPDRTPCPGGYRTDPVTCWRDLKCNTWWDGCCSRGLFGECWGCARTSCSGPDIKGRDPVCRRDEDLIGLLCYPKCRPGFVGNGPVCWRDITPYTKQSYGRGAGNPMKCAPGLDNVAGLCYRKCPPGFTMKSLGLCQQICPPGSTDFGVGCTREMYNRGAGDVPFNIYMKPRKAGVENFMDISHLIDYYTVENFTEFDASQPYETPFESFSNQNDFLQEFYNVNNVVQILESFDNETIMEYYDNAIVVNDVFEYGRNEAFDNLELFNVQNGNGFEGFSYLDSKQTDEICSNGYCGIPLYKTYSQYEQLASYNSDECRDAPIFKQRRSKYYKSLTPQCSSLKPKKVKNSRPVQNTEIVEPKYATFAPIDKESSIKSGYTISSSVYSINSSISPKATKEFTPKTGNTPKAKPFIRQAIKTLAKSFPTNKTDQTRLARRALRSVEDIKGALKDKEIKPIAKAIMKQVAMNPPMVIVKPRLAEKFYQIDI